jgi:hypothetical protein
MSGLIIWDQTTRDGNLDLTDIWLSISFSSLDRSAT